MLSNQSVCLSRADVVIDSSSEDVVQKVLEATDGRGAFAAFDAVGGEASKQLLSAVCEEGTLVVYGVLSGMTMTTGKS